MVLISDPAPGDTERGAAIIAKHVQRIGPSLAAAKLTIEGTDRGRMDGEEATTQQDQCHDHRADHRHQQ